MIALLFLATSLAASRRVIFWVSFLLLLCALQPFASASALPLGTDSAPAYRANSDEVLRVVSSPSDLLNQASLAAIKQWRYRPYVLNGEPAEVDTQIKVSYSLEGR